MMNADPPLLEYLQFDPNEENHHGDHQGGENRDRDAGNDNNDPPPSNAQAPQVPKRMINITSLFITAGGFAFLLAFSCITFIPAIIDATITIRDAIPSGNITACDWQDRFHSLASQYPGVGISEFAESKYSPQCVIVEEEQVAGSTVLESAFDAATTMAGVVYSGMIQAYFHIATALSFDAPTSKAVEPKNVSMDEPVLYNSLDIVHSFAEFWVQKDKEAMDISFADNKFEDILQNTIRLVRSTALKKFQEYIKMSDEERWISHLEGFLCLMIIFVLVTIRCINSLMFEDDPTIDACKRLATIAFLLRYIQTCEFWELLFESSANTKNCTAVSLLGIGLVLDLVFWLGTKCEHRNHFCRTGVHMATIMLVVRAIFMSTEFKELFPSVHSGYRLCALFLFLRLIRATVRDVRGLNINIWGLLRMLYLQQLLVDLFPRAAPTFVDFYAVLGVAPWSTTREIKRAYRDLARTTHPDRNPAADATKTFQVLQEANEILTDPDRRQQYNFSNGFPMKESASARDRRVIRIVQGIISKMNEA